MPISFIISDKQTLINILYEVNNDLSNFFNTTIQLNIYIIVIVAACYIAIHTNIDVRLF